MHTCLSAQILCNEARRVSSAQEKNKLRIDSEIFRIIEESISMYQRIFFSLTPSLEQHEGE